MMNTQTTYKDIADYFISLSNDTQNLITNLKLQKLLYYTQAWYLGIFQRPIFEDEFEAWVHGPVLPALYHEYKHLTYNPILEEKPKSEELFQKFESDLQSVINDVTEGYFGRTAYELEQLTHSEDPWIISRGDVAAGSNSSQVIDKNLMRDYYGKLVVA